MAAAQLVTAIKQELSEATPTEASHPEPVNLVDLEERILQLCSESPKGITDDVISCDQPSIDTERRLKALQRLLSQVHMMALLIMCDFPCGGL